LSRIKAYAYRGLTIVIFPTGRVTIGPLVGDASIPEFTDADQAVAWINAALAASTDAEIRR
jgi:hypothetical protein